MDGLAFAIALAGFFIFIGITDYAKAIVKVAVIKSTCKNEAPK